MAAMTELQFDRLIRQCCQAIGLEYESVTGLKFQAGEEDDLKNLLEEFFEGLE